jgi:hypothetical protein
MNSKKRPFWLKLVRVLLIGGASFLTVGVGSVLFFLWWIHSHVFSVSKYDPAIWFAQTTNETDLTCYRGGMAHDIIDHHLNINMTNTQVESLLGKPDGTSSPSHYAYTLGMCSGFKIDYDTLDVNFDDTGKYLNAAIHQH